MQSHRTRNNMGPGKSTMAKKYASPIQTSYGMIIGCGLPKYKTNNKPNKGKNRLHTILISESAYLIWKLRCEWKIERGEDPTKLHTKPEIHNKWLATINKRLLMDKLSTNKFRYGTKAIDK